MDTIEAMIAEYTAWCSAQELPQLSAEELLMDEYLTQNQRKYLRKFIERWDNADDNHT